MGRGDVVEHCDRDYEGDPGERVGFATRLTSPAEVDALYAELDANGLGKRQPWDAPWGMRYATVRDPHGVLVGLYADLASD